MVKKGIAFVKANGKDKAMPRSQQGRPVQDRDLYLLVLKTDARCSARRDPKLVGLNRWDAKA